MQLLQGALMYFIKILILAWSSNNCQTDVSHIEVECGSHTERSGNPWTDRKETSHKTAAHRTFNRKPLKYICRCEVAAKAYDLERTFQWNRSCSSVNHPASCKGVIWTTIKWLVVHNCRQTSYWIIVSSPNYMSSSDRCVHNSSNILHVAIVALDKSNFSKVCTLPQLQSFDNGVVRKAGCQTNSWQHNLCE